MNIATILLFLYNYFQSFTINQISYKYLIRCFVKNALLKNDFDSLYKYNYVLLYT